MTNNTENNDLSNIKLNTILYGPPGTGKTYHTVEMAYDIIRPKLESEEYNIKHKWFREQLADEIPLKHCVLTESIEEIGEYAFKETELESIIITEGVRYIRKGAFMGCEELKNIELPSTIETIEEDAFYGCGDIEIKINKPEDSVPGAPWRADDAKVIWAK